MSHIIELTDEQYETMRKVAARDQETPEQLLQRMVNALTETQGVFYHSDEELLRALGADDEELAELAQLEQQIMPTHGSGIWAQQTSKLLRQSVSPGNVVAMLTYRESRNDHVRSDACVAIPSQSWHGWQG